MRRIATLLVGVAAVGAVVVFGSGAGGTEGYLRGPGDLRQRRLPVPGEEVRIAGAKVGEITEVDVTNADEAAHDDGSPEPGRRWS